MSNVARTFSCVPTSNLTNMKLPRFWYALAVWIGILVTIFPTVAVAHGPLQSAVDVHRGPAGTSVQANLRYNKLEVVLNPDPDTMSNPALANHPHARLYKPHLPAPRLLLYEGRGKKIFRVPNVPEGRYVIVIFDPSEGWPRHRYTWTTLTVTDASLLPSTGPHRALASPFTLALLLVALGCCLRMFFAQEPSLLP